MRAPLRDLAVNVTGTHRVAGAARRAGAERLVFVSSGGAIYGETRRPRDRGEPRRLRASYYGVHKLAAEGHVALSGLPYAIARPIEHLWAPAGQRPGGRGRGGVRRAGRSRDQPLTIDGDGLQTRDFVHVRDVVDALVRLGDTAGPVGTWNVAPRPANLHRGPGRRRRARRRRPAGPRPSAGPARATCATPAVSSARLRHSAGGPWCRSRAGSGSCWTAPSARPMSRPVSAGILLFRRSAGGLEVLLAHPGGPYWKRQE